MALDVDKRRVKTVPSHLRTRPDFINNGIEPSHPINSLVLIYGTRPKHAVAQDATGVCGAQGEWRGKLSAVRPSPCSDGIPQSLPSRASSEHSVQSLGSLMRSDEATSVHFPQILALLTLLSGRSCHENCVGGLLWSLWSRWLRDAVPTSEKTSSPTVYKNNSGDFECLCKVFKKTRRCAAMQLKRSRAHLCKALRLLGVAQTAPSFRLWWGPQR